MSESNPEKPVWLLLADGTLERNEAGRKTVLGYCNAAREYWALNASMGGALLASLFLTYAWLDAVTLSFSIALESCGNGRYHCRVNCQAQAVRVLEQQILPKEVFPYGEFDSFCAKWVIEQSLRCDIRDLYDSLTQYPPDYNDLSVTLERGAIAALLENMPFDGRLALEAWGLRQPQDA